MTTTPARPHTAHTINPGAVRVRGPQGEDRCNRARRQTSRRPCCISWACRSAGNERARAGCHISTPDSPQRLRRPALWLVGVCFFGTAVPLARCQPERRTNCARCATPPHRGPASRPERDARPNAMRRARNCASRNRRIGNQFKVAADTEARQKSESGARSSPCNRQAPQPPPSAERTARNLNKRCAPPTCSGSRIISSWLLSQDDPARVSRSLT